MTLSYIEKDANIIRAAGKLAAGVGKHIHGIGKLIRHPIRATLASSKPNLSISQRPKVMLREAMGGLKWGGGIMGAGIVASPFVPHQRPL